MRLTTAKKATVYNSWCAAQGSGEVEEVCIEMKALFLQLTIIQQLYETSNGVSDLHRKR